MKKVAFLQPNYIPWKGYFDIINDVDLFVFSVDVQYSRHDWRNRNIVKTTDGKKWLTIPVGKSNKRPIGDVKILESKWQKVHYKTIIQNYSNAKYLSMYKDFLHHVYIDTVWENLSELNQYLVKTISKDYLGINTEFDISLSYGPAGAKHDRLLGLIKATGADVYVSGPAAKNYIVEQEFADAGIEIVWKDYNGYPEYPQLHGEFCHNVSILDLLFSTGPEAPYYIWGWRLDKL